MVFGLLLQGTFADLGAMAEIFAKLGASVCQTEPHH